MQDQAYSSENYRINYSLVGAGNSRLVFLHGLCGNRDIWKQQAAHFQDNFEILLPDLLGHGKSAPADPEQVTQLNIEVLTSLLKSLPPKRTILIGHSWGGSIVNGLMESGVADAYVFVDSPCLVSPEAQSEYRDWGDVIREQSDKYDFIKFDWFGDLLTEDCTKEVEEFVLNEVDKFDPEWIARFMECFPLPKAIEKELNVLVTEGRQFFSEGSHSSWMQIFPSANRWEFAGDGHFYFLESPAAFNEALSKFLSNKEAD